MKLSINGYPVTTPFMALDKIHHNPHRGIDLGLPMNTPVEAIGDGVITAITDEGDISFGKAIYLHLDDGKDVIYGHLNELDVKVGQHVQSGQVIGLSGSTGDSTGPHLHIQMSDHGKLIDPTPFVEALQPVKVWSITEVIKHPVDYVTSTLESSLKRMAGDAGSFLLTAFDEIALIAICAGVLGTMVSIPKAGKFTQAAFGIYIIVKVLEVAVAS